MPKVSVIIPVYNVEKYLRKCLDSVVGQTLKDIEIICVDDGSTDGSGAILDEYAAKDEQIKVIHQENQGQACSRNNALKIAQGEYILFLDSDDYIREDACEVLFKQALTYNLDMLSFGGTNFDNNSGELQKNTYYQFNYLPKNFDTKCFDYERCTQFIGKMAVSACLTFYRRQFLEQNHITFPPHLFFEDNVFFTHALLTAKRCGILQETLYFRRVHSESVTQNWNKHFADYLQICQKVIDLVRSMPVSGEIKVKYYQSYTQSPANIYARFGSFDKERYKEKLSEFLQKNHIKSIIKYKLFGFMPLFKIELV